MKQYLVNMTCGAYEDSSLCSLCMFFIASEDLTPGQVALEFKALIEECCFAVGRNVKPQNLFREFFTTPAHEFDPVVDDVIAESDWSYAPWKGMKIDKYVSLQGMDWFLDENSNYFQADDNGEVKSEVFEEYIFS